MRKFKVTKGRLVIDDTDRKRAKNTKKIYGTHKTKDKKTNGYVMAQVFVVSVLVTDVVTIPLSMEIYQPDPVVKKWKLDVLKWKKDFSGKAKMKNSKPAKPRTDPQFPSKEHLASRLLHQMKRFHPTIEIQSVLFDNGYLTKWFVNRCRAVFPKAQIISKMKLSQLVKQHGKKSESASHYFASRQTRELEICIRGQKKQKMKTQNARLFVPSLGRKCHIVAVRYLSDQDNNQNTDFRFIIAIDPTWSADAILREFGFRWLIEVAFEDWKLYDGYGNAASQRGVEGVRCGLALSLLTDGFLLSHPKQLACAATGRPLRTAGTMVKEIQKENFVHLIEGIFSRPDPQEAAKELLQFVEFWVIERASSKHMSGYSLEASGNPFDG